MIWLCSVSETSKTLLTNPHKIRKNVQGARLVALWQFWSKTRINKGFYRELQGTPRN